MNKIKILQTTVTAVVSGSTAMYTLSTPEADIDRKAEIVTSFVREGLRIPECRIFTASFATGHVTMLVDEVPKSLSTILERFRDPIAEAYAKHTPGARQEAEVAV